MRISKKKDWVAMSLDWSEFDVNVPKWMIEDAFSIIEGTINFKEMSDDNKIIRFKNSNARKYRKAWNWLKWNFIHTKIMDFDGTMYHKNHGIPSGSFFTQLVGSVVNMIACHFLMSLSGVKIQKERYLGDDSLLFVERNQFDKLNLTLVARFALVFLHFKINVKKVKITTQNGEIEFLGYKGQYHRFVYNPLEWFKSCLHTTDKVSDLETSVSRMRSYYELGGCHSELFSSFYEFFFYYYNLQEQGSEIDSTASDVSEEGSDASEEGSDMFSDEDT